MSAADEIANRVEVKMWDLDNERPHRLNVVLDEYADVVTVLDGELYLSRAPEDIDRLLALESAVDGELKGV